jgi:hypothetical protein
MQSVLGVAEQAIAGGIAKRTQPLMVAALLSGLPSPLGVLFFS